MMLISIILSKGLGCWRDATGQAVGGVGFSRGTTNYGTTSSTSTTTISTTSCTTTTTSTTTCTSL